MKHCNYKFGTFKCHAYTKTVGQGYEVGFYFGTECVFVGNFIHYKEAAKWWGTMNKELKTFTKRYGVGGDASLTWYTKFFSHHLYKTYYSFLDTEFAKYHKEFDKACKQDTKKYNTYKSKWTQSGTYTLKKAS